MRTLALILAVSLFAVSPVLADLGLADAEISIAQTGVGSGNGGEFLITVLDGFLPGVGGIGSSYKTFCIEYSEHIQNGGTYFAVVNPAGAVAGGVGGTNPDPVSDTTGALYENWLTLNSSDDALANQRQLAIWFQEEEAAYFGNTTDDSGIWKQSNGSSLPAVYQNILYSTIDTLISSMVASSGNVRALNLWNDNQLTSHAQDQLIPIPAPGAAALAMIGMSAVGWIRRRMS